MSAILLTAVSKISDCRSVAKYFFVNVGVGIKHTA